MWLNPVIVFYAIFQMGYGIWGTIHAGEIKSAIGGVAIGILQLVCVALHKKYPQWSRIASLILALAVVGQFGKKFFVDGIWNPAGVEVITSLALAIALILGHVLAQRTRSV